MFITNFYSQWMKCLDEYFWLSKEPIFSLSVYRLGFGVLVCSEVISWLPYTKELFSSQGFHLGMLSSWAPSPALALGLVLSLVLTSFCLTIGFYTRASIFITLIIWTFLYLIDGINEKAMHSMVIVILIVLFFSQSHARYSLDDILRIQRKQDRLKDEGSIFPHRILQIQFVQVYFFCGLIKILNPEWLNGKVLYEVFMSRWSTDLGTWVSGWMPMAGFALMGIIVVLYECLGSFLLLVPKVKNYVIWIGIFFHVATLLTLYVGFLALHFIWALLMLFPGWESSQKPFKAYGLFHQKAN